MGQGMSMDKLIKPRRQTNWDWRAAGNFIGGGSGTGLLLFSAITAVGGAFYPLLFLAGLGLVGAGLLCVWMEIGRPLRALNVFRHAQTSWMTREALVAPVLFLCGAAAAWTGGTAWLCAAALLALLFLYCQARIVRAAKGIPAWRAQASVPLFVVTGLTEGAGLLAAVLSASGVKQPPWLAVALLALLAVRIWAWRAYRQELRTSKTPNQALAALDKADLSFSWTGHAAVATLLFATLVPGGSNGTWMIGIAGALAVAGGWLLKYTVIVRASYNQGYALARVPVRGSGVPL
jgi:phenylacetyl-CoA:acceptor oxidoreductase 26-kDa subunit